MPRLSLSKSKKTRDPEKLTAKTFKMHPMIADAFQKQAVEEGCHQINLLEKAIVFYINHGGQDAKIG